ncbi:MAG: CCA tRNA nucleotidyltransferase [Ignavibacteria bacterium]|nr:CCA tRNA nucleotidyltransferase [Ignavibacteria bacterium]MBT8383688.1 CCA tRNA nucleotidyltransferase [Ignavibacteria bacterium]MBT8391131.1 CCA tRNA nucleotidyltransferase [Ignavibacteria bacterium]NNJ52990.1 HD domain-containing protein [Ignavibacteriaceae bacterium]NNL20008.1 HD domain-containing protein [Ignavibacteriaceae bacterium]
MNIIKQLLKYDFLKYASNIAGELESEVYIVGGFVRDLLLKRELSDIDFLIVGKGLQFAETFAHKMGIEDIVIYKNYGTAHFVYKGINFEFVAARKESYRKTSRKPLISEGTFKDDISRRDFTINTLAVSIAKNNFGELIDTYDGLGDIENKIIRTPVDPEKTFDDDPLRILRAFRFSSQLNFIVAEEIMIAAEKLRDRLKIVSQERITDEFLKIMKSPKPSIGLKLLYTSQIMEIVFPEIARMGGVEQREEYHHKDVFYHTCQVIDKVAEISDDVWLRFTALVHDIAKPQTKRFVEGTGWTFHGHEEIGARMMKSIFKRMKLPFGKLEYVEKLVRLHLRPIALVSDDVTDSAIRRLIVNADEELDDLIKLCRADITSKNPQKVSRYLNNYEIVMKKVIDVKEKDKLRAFQSPVRGEEIMKVCNLKPSKKVGEIKSAIEDAILDGIIGNNYEEAYKYLLKIKDKF